MDFLPADLDEAIAQAAFVATSLNSRAVATEAQVDRFRDQLRRLLAELPDDLTVRDLRDHLEPDAGEPQES